MQDFSQVITQLINHPLLPLFLVLSALVFILFINRRKILLLLQGLKTRYCLNNLGLEQVSNLSCPDGLGHNFTIDRLLLRHDGITLIIYKKYPGKIFCADHIDHWTQMLGLKSYRFKNPLFELDYQIKAVSDCVPEVPINGFLFFDHLSEFPKGHPDRIIHPQCIPQELRRNNRHQVQVPVMSAWKNIQELLQQNNT